MKVAIYCHVSTNKQTTENQKIRLVDYCKRKGWKYEVIEETMSTRKPRPKDKDVKKEKPKEKPDPKNKNYYKD